MKVHTFAAFILVSATSAFAECTASSWYSTTAHGKNFRNASVYGAKGDGVTDDTAALLAALAGSSTPTTHATVVYLPPGTYVVSATLPLYFNFFLTADPVCRATVYLKNSTLHNGYVIDGACLNALLTVRF